MPPERSDSPPGRAHTKGRAYVGCYAAQDRGQVPGAIHVFDVVDNASLTHRFSAGAGIEAGFLCLAPDRRHLYALDERKSDGRGQVRRRPTVSAFEIEPADGSLTLINSQPVLGAYPSYASVDTRGEFLVTACHGSFDHVERIVETDRGFSVENVYDDSTVCLHPISTDGSLEGLADVYVLEGHGVDPGKRPQAGGYAQASSHAHSALFDPTGTFVIACDKGADRIHVLRLNRRLRRLEPVQIWLAPPATGPRHPAFCPLGQFVFVTNELSSTVSTFSFDSSEGTLVHVASVTATSPGFEGYNEPADVKVHPHGRLVFVNNRGEDTVVAFMLDAANGKLTFAHSVSISPSPHPGHAARSIEFDATGRFLFVADRPADRVVAFVVDPRTGAMTAASDMPLPQPAFVLCTA